MRQKVTCNKCGRAFKIKPKTKIHKSDIEELYFKYFKCPKCKEKYTAYYIDKEGKELQKRIRAERIRYNNISSGKEETLKRIKDMQTMLKVRMDSLKTEMKDTQLER